MASDLPLLFTTGGDVKFDKSHPDDMVCGSGKGSNCLSGFKYSLIFDSVIGFSSFLVSSKG
jgi:hypothetical protein